MDIPACRTEWYSVSIVPESGRTAWVLRLIVPRPYDGVVLAVSISSRARTDGVVLRLNKFPSPYDGVVLRSIAPELLDGVVLRLNSFRRGP